MLDNPVFGVTTVWQASAWREDGSWNHASGDKTTAMTSAANSTMVDRRMDGMFIFLSLCSGRLPEDRRRESAQVSLQRRE